MSSLVFFHFRDSLHTYGIECLSTDKYTVENFVYNEMMNLCSDFNCRYFVQGFDVSKDHGVSWAFIEFFGEPSQDKIIGLCQEFNKRYGKIYHGGEILFDEPTADLLRKLKLL